jgi:aminoglycoside 6'-N-acetyltransferase I
MNPNVQISAPAGDHDDAWLALRSSLWPEVPRGEHLRSMMDTLYRGYYVRLAVESGGSAVGFVEASKRADYVNGSTSSPVAFLEGLYVASGWRRSGIARQLVESVANWARSEGLVELASDSLLGNARAHTVHRALGFAETERVVYFLRPL